MVSEVPHWHPCLRLWGEGTAEQSPGEGGLFPAEYPRDGASWEPAALPACAGCSSAELSLLPLGLPHPC